MKIALNATIATKNRTGTGHYAANLTASLMQLDHDHELVVYCDQSLVDWFGDRRNGHDVLISGIEFESAMQRILWEQTQLNHDLKSRDVELLHSLAFTSPYFTSVKTVVTVHDLVFRNYPRTISLAKKLYYKPIFARSIKKAQRVITVSESVQRDLEAWLNLQPSKVISVPEAAGTEFIEKPANCKIKQTLRKLRVDYPYLLTVGTLEPRKNLLLLVSAFNSLKRESSLQHKLVIVGKVGWHKVDDRLRKLVHDSKDIVLTGYVEQSDLPAMYSAADLFLFPSLYEGFGLPLLEAFACGVPVIASDIAAHREVADNAALFVAPSDVDEWKDAILKLLDDGVRRKELSALGLERVKEFSWRKAARKTLRVYGMDGVNGEN